MASHLNRQAAMDFLAYQRLEEDRKITRSLLNQPMSPEEAARALVRKLEETPAWETSYTLSLFTGREKIRLLVRGKEYKLSVREQDGGCLTSEGTLTGSSPTSIGETVEELVYLCREVK